MNRQVITLPAVLITLLFGACVKPTATPPNPDAHLKPFAAWNAQSPAAPPRETPPSPPPPTGTPSPTPPKKETKLAPAVPEQPAPQGNLPYAKPVPGKPGFVFSPYEKYKGFIDVRGFPPGTEVKDPYSGKTFLVP